MTSADEQAFLTAIVAAPEDDTPRLVFADWLDERNRGDDAARAALIRAQCRAELLPPESKERKKLEREAKAVLKQHGDRWAKELRESKVGDSKLVESYEFRRGFLAHVVMSGTTFARQAEKLFEIAPTIRSAYFREAANEMSAVAKCEHLARLASVDVRQMCWCGYCRIQNDLRALFNSKHLGGLTQLSVAGDRMDAAGAKRLAKSTALKRLTSLDASDNPLGDDGAEAICASKNLKHLANLDLTGAQLGDAALESLAGAENLPALRRLTLSANRFTAAGLEALVGSPLFAGLEALELMNTGIGDAGARVLASAPEGTRLGRLDVTLCKITARVGEKLKKRYGKGVKA